MKFTGRTVRARAFTLIEILVAMTIFSILVGALYGVLFGALRLRETTFRAVEEGPARDQIAAIIRRDLAGLVAPAGTLAGPIQGQPVEDNRDTLTLFTTTGILNDNEPWGDIQQVEYYLEAPTDRDPALGWDLIRRPTRNLLASTVKTEQSAARWRLTRGVSSLKFFYWDGEQWLDLWDSTTQDNANPLAVEVRIEFVNSSEARHIEKPLDLVCETAPQPRPTPTPAGGQ